MELPAPDNAWERKQQGRQNIHPFHYPPTW